MKACVVLYFLTEGYLAIEPQIPVVLAGYAAPDQNTMLTEWK